ncbi:DUF5945 family protein [Streptococcus caprae]|uniref:DUF5945 family protein n=1 Tax=Streptococcus caprae TaxID=1640501 RepID=A0ABV8CXY1_9STRE
MITPSDWTYEGQLDTPAEQPTTPDQERAKIAALFKPTSEELQADSIDYLAAFEKHKKGKQAPVREQDKVVSTQLSNPKEDITDRYKAYLTELLTSHEEETVHYRVELERFQELVAGKEKVIKTIKAIMTAMDTLD